VIGFSDEDYVRVSFPHNNALVVTLTIANHSVHQILVDIGGSADIVYWSIFEQLNLGRENIVPTQFPLMGFAGEQVKPEGSIELAVMASTV
jgi:hypothetical protein